VVDVGREMPGNCPRSLGGATESGERTRHRVLIGAPRRNALGRKSSRWRGRHRQHARRVRSPERRQV